MKKYLVILITLMVVSALTLASCSTASTPSTTPPPSTTAQPTTSSAPSTSTAPATSATPAATTTPAPSSPVAARTIKFSYTMPKGAAIGKGFEWFGPAFEKATNGRYKVEIYPGSSLLPPPAALDSVKSGAVEMAFTSTGTFPSQFPLGLVSSLPSVEFPQDTVKNYAMGNSAWWEFYNTTPEIQNEFKDVVLLQPLVLDPYKLVSKKTQIKSAADFKGLKVGGSGQKMKIVTTNGGAEVHQIPPDSYLNMDKGVTDAAFITWAQVNDYKIFEIADWYLEQSYGNGTGLILMNKEFYNSMDSADQKILMDTWAQAQDVSAEGSIDDNVIGVKAIEDAGKSIYTPTAAEAAAWEAAAAPAIQEWKDDCKSQGIDDATITKILDKWKSIHTDYLSKME